MLREAVRAVHDENLIYALLVIPVRIIQRVIGR